MTEGIRCVVNCESDEDEELLIQFVLPFVPNFSPGQTIHLAETVDKAFVKSQNWDESIELHKDFTILEVSHSLEHRYMMECSTHYYVTLRLK